MFFVYILEAEESKRYYIGQTENLIDRIRRHNEGKNLSTKAFIPWKLKWWKDFETRSEAVRVERKIKGIKKRAGIQKFVLDEDFSGCGAVGPVPLAERGSSKNLFRETERFFGTSALNYSICSLFIY